MSEESKNQFREDEVIFLSHYDKQSGKQIQTMYPKIGGRLRLSHEDNETLSIQTSIFQFDGNVAVVSAKCSTVKGDFSGIGLASVERDKRLALSILELAESRAIARSLRFAGYGCEYCSAEEISHLENGNGKNGNGDDFAPGHSRKNGEHETGPVQFGQALKEHPLANKGKAKGANTNHQPQDSPGTGGRLSGKQHKYILKLGEEAGLNKSQLNEQCLSVYGVALDYLQKADASSLINQLLAQ